MSCPAAETRARLFAQRAELDMTQELAALLDWLGHVPLDSGSALATLYMVRAVAQRGALVWDALRLGVVVARVQ